MTQDSGKPNRDEDAIDANLKRVYDDLLNQEVPDRFRDLLEQLKSQDKSAGGQDGGDAT